MNEIANFKIFTKDGSVLIELGVEDFCKIYNDHLLLKKIKKEIMEVSNANNGSCGSTARVKYILEKGL